MIKSSIILTVLAVAATSGSAQRISETKRAQITGSAKMIYGADISLPAQGLWHLKQQGAANQDTRLYLVPPAAVKQQFEGVRMAKVKREKNINRGRYNTSCVYSACLDYARKHDGIGPAVISDIDTNLYAYAAKRFTQSPWNHTEHSDLKGPFAFLIPGVKFEFNDAKKNRRVLREKRTILAVELRPFVDDHKHWVSYTDGSSERAAISDELIMKHSLQIKPVLSKKDDPANQKKADEYAYKLLATCAEGTPDKITVNLYNPITDKDLISEWDTSAAGSPEDGLLIELGKAREREWLPYLLTQSPGTLEAWASGAKDSLSRDAIRDRARRNRATSAMSVLGGRAAMRETLQMQLLNSSSKVTEHNIAIETLAGVKVKSHPFDKMLEGNEGGELEMANAAPADHFFVYVAKPASMLPMLDDGADFMSEFGGSLTGSKIKYYLKARYLARLGVDEKWLQAFLGCGAIQECALITPDLFFIDGTEITVISRLSNYNLLAPLLKLAGLPGLSEGKLIETKCSNGKPVFWILKKDLLIVSTSSSEAGLIEKLIANKGKGSLGQSAEFHYMLTKLPLNKSSRALAYLSDPFIRKLVSPSIKIAQLRRAAKKAELQFITGKALLAKLDGVEECPIDTLKQLGYLNEDYAKAGITINSDLIATSSEYGTLSSMSTISDRPVTIVSRVEADAYKSYMKNYTRFWRQFFDPIAIRLDDTADRSLEATTFILPLIDSSIYNSLKDIVMNAEDGIAMKTPKFTHEPVLKLSLNLKEKNWQEITKNMGEFTTRYSGLNSAILDDFGPAVHLAIHDADPVIALGSGDIMGAFGGNIMGMGRGSEMMAIPFLLSMLTRPCTLAVETKNPQATLRHLRMAATSYGRSRRSDDFRAKLYQIKGKDSWVYSLDLENVIKIRFGLEVRDGFLFIKNIPWSKQSTVAGIETTSLNGVRLAVYPAACQIQLPGLHAAASEHRSASAFAGAAMLYPLISSGYADISNAPEAHMKLFGYLPVHPSGGNWIWENGNVSSTAYGSISRREQPEYKEGDDDFGLMKKIKKLSIETQFEDDGLRTKVKWQMR